MALVSIYLGVLLGAWILPTAIAISGGGWAAVRSLPVGDWLFPTFPDYSTGTMAKVLNVVSPLFGMAGAGTGLWLAMRWWRFLMVKKLKWMTDKEVMDFFNRDPG